MIEGILDKEILTPKTQNVKAQLVLGMVAPGSTRAGYWQGARLCPVRPSTHWG
jgi:hypothetical protein